MQSRARRLTRRCFIARGSRGARAGAGKLALITLACLLALLPAAGVLAQDVDEEEVRGSFRFPAMSPTQSATDAPEMAAATGWKMPNVIVDTDTGVDDAAALAWLFNQAGRDPSKILGIATVVGNTTVDNATENVLYMLAQTPWKPKKWPAVYKGASAPLQKIPSKTGQLLHGMDGLGYARAFSGWTSERYPNHVTQGTTDFYCRHAEKSSESEPITVITLGPLTNIALALDEPDCPMQNYRYVVLGGAKESGNQTPAAEYNFWQDPEAAQKVMGAGLDITLVPREQFDKFTLTLSQVESLLRSSYSAEDSWGGVANVVGLALCWYAGIQSFDFATGDILDFIPVSVPDPAAMMYALNPSRYGAPVTRALVRVPKDVDDPADPGYRDGILVRGQSVIGYYEPYPEAYTMVYSDAEINDWIDYSFQVAEDEAEGDPLYATQVFFYLLFTQQEAIPANASIPTNLYGSLMRQDYLSEFSVVGPPQGSCFPDTAAGASAATVLSGLRLDSLDTEIQEDTPDSSVFIPLMSR